MKLAKIEYARCDEWDGYTLVWVPDSWTQDVFRAAVHRAEDAYLSFLAQFDEDAEPPVGKAWGAAPYKEHPEKTVSEVDALWAEQRRVYSEWETEYNKGRKGFPAFLAAEGMEPLYEHGPDLTAEVDWGHRHGVRLEYEAKPATIHRLVRVVEQPTQENNNRLSGATELPVSEEGS